MYDSEYADETYADETYADETYAGETYVGEAKAEEYYGDQNSTLAVIDESHYAAAALVIPDGWEHCFDDEGNEFFFNGHTGESSWQLPESSHEHHGAVMQSGGHDLADNWEVCYDDSGVEFYHNCETGESQWEKPAAATEDIWGSSWTAEADSTLGVLKKEIQALNRGQGNKPKRRTSASSVTSMQSTMSERENRFIEAQKKRDLAILHLVCANCSSITFATDVLGKYMHLINQKSEPKGYTALHMACKTCPRVDIIRILLDNGADVNIPSDKGYTPLDLALKSGRDKLLVTLLRAKGAKESELYEREADADKRTRDKQKLARKKPRGPSEQFGTAFGD